MSEDWTDLLARRDALRFGSPSPEIDAALERLQNRLLTALRQASDEIGEVGRNSSHDPALSARVDTELLWIKESARAFGGAQDA